jgi:hypothetical protein
MRIAIEESGNFGFPDNGRFESYVLIAVIAPDSAMSAVEKAATALRRTMRLPELKANKLGGKRLAPTAEAISGLPLQAVAYAFDSHMMDRRFIAEFRMRQAIRIARVRDELLERGAVADKVRQPAGWSAVARAKKRQIASVASGPRGSVWEPPGAPPDHACPSPSTFRSSCIRAPRRSVHWQRV